MSLFNDPRLDCLKANLAGYSVLTYLLGVGDDNLMLAPDGKSYGELLCRIQADIHPTRSLLPRYGYHFGRMNTKSCLVDFGYILGRDPKPYPPPVKVCKEMVDAMGGTGSSHYARFQSLSYTAFIGLRKNANLILNLVALMVDAGIQDIQLEPDKAVWKVCLPLLRFLA